MKTLYERTFRIDRLYHRFLRPKNIPSSELDLFIDALEINGFIKLTDDPDRYEETAKLSNQEYKRELFKLIDLIKGGVY